MTGLEITNKMFLKLRFPNKQTESFKNTRKSVLFLSETHPKHRKHIPPTIPNVFVPTIISDEPWRNRFNLFGAIVSLMQFAIAFIF